MARGQRQFATKVSPLPSPGQGEAKLRQNPIIQSLREVPQNPLWHPEGDVGEHTILTLKALEDIPEFQKLSIRERQTLYLGTFFHDWGKLETTVLEEGVWRARGHAKRGSQMTRAYLWNLGVDPAMREEIANLVALHMIPAHWLKRDPERTLIRLSYATDLSKLCMLSRADTRGRSIENPEETTLDLFEETAKDLGIWQKPYAFETDYQRWWYFQKEDRHHDVNPGHPKDRPTLTITHGLPASGKSHWVEKERPDTKIVSLDNLRAKGVNEASVAGIGRQELRKILGQKEDAVWDATTLTRQQRQPLLGLAKDYGYKTEIVCFEASPGETRERMAQRGRIVGPEIIQKMLQRWEYPTYEEAEKLIVVSS